jgi:hypothetical protein
MVLFWQTQSRVPGCVWDGLVLRTFVTVIEAWQDGSWSQTSSSNLRKWSKGSPKGPPSSRSICLQTHFCVKGFDGILQFGQFASKVAYNIP